MRGDVLAAAKDLGFNVLRALVFLDGKAANPGQVQDGAGRRAYFQLFSILVNDFVYRAVSDCCVIVFEGHFKRNYIRIRDVARAFLHFVTSMR
jgi:hypothetical protein